jgi:hypothetical protein
MNPALPNCLKNKPEMKNPSAVTEEKQGQPTRSLRGFRRVSRRSTTLYADPETLRGIQIPAGFQ